MLFRVSFFFLLLTGGWVSAFSEADSPDREAQLGTVTVRASEQEPLKRHEIIKTEVVSKETIEHKKSQTLADAVSNQVGVDTQNSCANCGSKRITVNGLRGEHTTVLIDGVPMHSAVSSFYGMDAIPVVGIESIEVSRGSGASLIAPEAIGGVVNIITARPKETGIQVNGTLGNAATGLVSVLGSVVGGEGKHRLVLAGQVSNQGYWDVDRNGVSEAPDLSNHSFFLKGTSDFTPNNRIDVRYARQLVDILGGTTKGIRPTTYVQDLTTTPLFEAHDVSKRFLDGSDDRLTDYVGLSRHEGALRWNHFFSSDSQIQLTSSLSEQKQTSFYMHGYDYNNRDLLSFNEGRFLFSLGESHFLTLGAEIKNEDMSSTSEKLYTVAGLAKDDFSYRSRAAYLQDVWLISDGVELSSALRVDNMRVNFLAQTAKEFEIDQTLIAPRFHLKAVHSPHWTSRLMYGRGYRPPLSFFESQHGLNEFGFEVNINEVETSHSLGYSLTYSQPGLSVTGSSHRTWLTNMAYADGDVSFGNPALFQNAHAEYKVWANDIVVSWDVASNWNLQLSYENFSLQDEYKFRLPAAAIEQRARIISDLHFGNWEFVNTFTWVGSRNLSQYNYGQHYRTLRMVTDPLFPADPPTPEVDANKGNFAPPFLTWDIYLGWKWREKYTFYASVQNVLDYTQTGYGDSPLNWSSHGNDPAHFHLDNNHTWGPLRGRLVSVGLKVEL